MSQRREGIRKRQLILKIQTHYFWFSLRTLHSNFKNEPPKSFPFPFLVSVSIIDETIYMLMSDLTKKEWENFSCCSLRHILEFFTYIILNLAFSKNVWSSEQLYLYQSLQWPSLWVFELMSLWWSEFCHREQYISVSPAVWLMAG